jgi:uncharacterized membrane protein YphA (DoxX/SURF4 family)
LVEIAITCRFILGTLFFIAGLAKVARRADFEHALERYDLLPPRSVAPVATWLPRAELVAAVFLLVGLEMPVAAGALAAFLAVFSVAIAVNLLRGRIIDCGCFGPAAPEKITWLSVARNGALFAMALIVASVRPAALTVVSAFTAGPSATISGSDAFALLIAGALTALAFVLMDDARGLARSASLLRRELSDS